MVKQTQEQKQNVKVVINLAETKKRKKRRRRRIREPPQGKSSFQQILRDNQAPQVIVRRIYDQSPYLDELQRLRSQQPEVAVPADGVRRPSVPLTSQANQKGSLTARLGGGTSAGGENTQAVMVRAGERMSVLTDHHTSPLQGGGDPPPVDLPAVKRRKERSDKGKKRDKGGALNTRFENAFQAQREAMSDAGYETEGSRGFGYSVYKGGRQIQLGGGGGGMSESEREQMRQRSRLNQLAMGTNTEGQV
jgi:hypothetical protein